MLRPLLFVSCCGFSAALNNVLMITVDDLRPQLKGAYEMPFMSTPNLDAFAAKATTFQHAYCQQAACSPVVAKTIPRSSASNRIRNRYFGMMLMHQQILILAFLGGL